MISKLVKINTIHIRIKYKKSTLYLSNNTKNLYLIVWINLVKRQIQCSSKVVSGHLKIRSKEDWNNIGLIN
jgi:hypothetical protein